MTLISNLLALTASWAGQLRAQVLLGGKITMLVPAGFNYLTESARREKYPGTNAPAYVLSSLDGSVNIAFDHKRVALKPGEVHKLEQVMRAQFASAKIISSEVRKINGVEFLLLDVETPLQEGPIRNLLAFTSLENRLLTVSYNYLLLRDASCVELGKRLIESIAFAPAHTK